MQLLFFFFQAEDGIRDVAVTGVQTCALPILVDANHLEMQFILSDPKTYTAPWVGDKKILNRVNTSDRVQPGLWGSKPDGKPYGDIREDLCLYSEQESFFIRIDAEGNKGLLSIQKKK